MQSQQQLEKRGLALARGPGDGHEFPGLYREVHILQHQLVGRSVAEREIDDSDVTVNNETLQAGSFRIGGRGHDVGQTLEMQTEQSELHQLIHKSDGAVVEGLPKRNDSAF